MDRPAAAGRSSRSPAVASPRGFPPGRRAGHRERCPPARDVLRVASAICLPASPACARSTVNADASNRTRQRGGHDPLLGMATPPRRGRGRRRPLLELSGVARRWLPRGRASHPASVGGRSPARRVLEVFVDDVAVRAHGAHRRPGSPASSPSPSRGQCRTRRRRTYEAQRTPAGPRIHLTPSAVHRPHSLVVEARRPGGPRREQAARPPGLEAAALRRARTRPRPAAPRPRRPRRQSTGHWLRTGTRRQRLGQPVVRPVEPVAARLTAVEPRHRLQLGDRRPMPQPPPLAQELGGRRGRPATPGRAARACASVASPADPAGPWGPGSVRHSGTLAVH